VNKPLPRLSRALPALVGATVEQPTTRDLRAPGHQLLAPMRASKLLGRSRCTTYHTSAQATDHATHIAHVQMSQRMIVDPAALLAAWIGRHDLHFSAQHPHTTRLRIGEPPIGRCAVAWAGALKARRCSCSCYAITGRTAGRSVCAHRLLEVLGHCFSQSLSAALGFKCVPSAGPIGFAKFR
jgi:hypothetical protein